MKSVTIELDTIDKVKEFTNITSKQDFDVKLHAGKYDADGKSIMSIFSLEPLKQSIICEVEEPYADAFFKEIQSFIVE